MNQIGENIYINPWKKINKLNAKIVDFRPNGDAIVKRIPKHRIRTISSTIEALRDKKKDPVDHVTGDRDVVSDLLNAFNFTMHNNGTQKRRLKVLTHCNKSRTVCRFLACPNIKKHCVLCEVSMYNYIEGDTTHCESYDTSFLNK